MNSRRQVLQLCLNTEIIIIIRIDNQFLPEVLHRFKFCRYSSPLLRSRKNSLPPHCPYSFPFSFSHLISSPSDGFSPFPFPCLGRLIRLIPARLYFRAFYFSLLTHAAGTRRFSTDARCRFPRVVVPDIPSALFPHCRFSVRRPRLLPARCSRESRPQHRSSSITAAPLPPRSKRRLFIFSRLSPFPGGHALPFPPGGT